MKAVWFFLALLSVPAASASAQQKDECHCTSGEPGFEAFSSPSNPKNICAKASYKRSCRMDWDVHQRDVASNQIFIQRIQLHLNTLQQAGKITADDARFAPDRIASLQQLLREGGMPGAKAEFQYAGNETLVLLGFIALSDAYLLLLDKKELADDLDSAAIEQFGALAKAIASRRGVQESKGKIGTLTVSFACLKYQASTPDLSNIAIAANAARIEGPCAR
jgi:hypothetical protein